MSEFGRVTVKTKLDQLSQIMTDFQSEQLNYDRSADRTRDPKQRSTLAIPLHHRSLKHMEWNCQNCYVQNIICRFFVLLFIIVDT